MNKSQEYFRGMMESLNAGLYDKSQLDSFIKGYVKWGIEKGNSEEVKNGLSYILPEEAYNKSHPDLDKTVEAIQSVLKDFPTLEKVENKVK